MPQRPRPQPIDHARFLDLLSAEFPEVIEAFTRYEKGLLHCEMGAFRRVAEQAMDTGRLWQAEKYFRFIERVLKEATPEVENAVEISFLEDLALGEFTEVRYRAIEERMPERLRAKLIRVNARWK
jgi:hypothetical protein